MLSICPTLTCSLLLRFADEGTEAAPAFRNQLSSSQFLPGPSLAEECQGEPLSLSASFSSGTLASDIQPPLSSPTPPSSALGLVQPHRTVPSWSPCAYGFSGSNFPTWEQQHAPPPSGNVLSAQTGSLSCDSGLATNLSPGSFAASSCGGQLSLHEVPHKQVGGADENPVPSPSLSHPPSSTHCHTS